MPTVSGAAVLPVREMVKTPGFAPASDAVASLATMLTVGSGGAGAITWKLLNLPTYGVEPEPVASKATLIVCTPAAMLMPALACGAHVSHPPVGASAMGPDLLTPSTST